MLPKNALLRCMAGMLLFVLAVFSLAGEERFALVIGNGNYTSVTPLKNPVNDAADMAAALKGLGFEVDLLRDAGLEAMDNAVVRLGNRLYQSKGSCGFFFYAGHGVQSNGVNYLIPVDAAIASESFLKTRALAAQSVLDTLQAANNGLNVIILDACRDNPFGWARSSSRGLSIVGGQPTGSIIAYATSAGSVAQDGVGRNGLFTSQLLKNLKTPGLEIKEVFNRTGADVKRASNNQQIPAIYSQFFDSVYLAGSAGTGSAGPGWGDVILPLGSLNLSTVSEGIVEFDGQSKKLPAGGTVDLSGVTPGTYQVKISYSDGQTETRTIKIESGSALGVAFSYRMASPVATVPKAGDQSGINSIGMTLVMVPSGSFIMGSPTNEAGRLKHEIQHQVTLSGYSISNTEITQTQYQKVMGKNPSHSVSGAYAANRPVEQVTWYDAVEFCNKLSEQEGLAPAYSIKGSKVTCDFLAGGYRLPTEAEWEFAARGANQNPTQNTAFAGGSKPDELGWYQTNTKSSTQPAAQKKPNALGLYDMSGNVWEWCWDLYDDYSTADQVDPTGGTKGSNRLLRGGSAFDGVSEMRSANRRSHAADYKRYNVGFRVVKSAPR